MQWKQETENPSRRLKKNTGIGIAILWLHTLAHGWAHQCLTLSVTVSSTTVLPASIGRTVRRYGSGQDSTKIEGRTVRRFMWGVVCLRFSPANNAPRADTHIHIPPEARQKASLPLPPLTQLVGSLVVPTFRGCISAGQGSSVWC